MMMNPNEIYIEGNFYLLEGYFEKLRQEHQEPYKYLYVGDHFLTDCAYGSKSENFSSLAVVENLNYERPKEDETEDEKSHLGNYLARWGSFFNCKHPVTGVEMRHTWANFIEKNADHSIPLLSHLKKFIK